MQFNEFHSLSFGRGQSSFTIESSGGPGRKAGEFFHLHSLDVDPQGNIVTGESQGYRVQKFIYKGLSTAAR